MNDEEYETNTISSTSTLLQCLMIMNKKVFYKNLENFSIICYRK